jgi:hypothetical protein
VAADGQARHVTRAYWDANEAFFQQAWKNALPVGWAQVYDLHQRGLVGPDL